jgi:hypothetical protein
MAKKMVRRISIASMCKECSTNVGRDLNGLSLGGELGFAHAAQVIVTSHFPPASAAPVRAARSTTSIVSQSRRAAVALYCEQKIIQRVL